MIEVSYLAPFSSMKLNLVIKRDSEPEKGGEPKIRWELKIMLLAKSSIQPEI